MENIIYIDILLPIIGTAILVVSLYLAYQIVQEQKKAEISLSSEEDIIEKFEKKRNKNLVDDMLPVHHYYRLFEKSLEHLNKANIANQNRMTSSYRLAALTATVAVLFSVYSFLNQSHDVKSIQLIFGLIMSAVTILYLKIYFDCKETETIFMKNAEKKEHKLHKMNHLRTIMRLTKDKSSPEEYRIELYNTILETLKKEINTD